MTHTITSAARELGTSWKLIRELLYEHDLGEWHGKGNKLVRFSDEDVVRLGELVKEHKEGVDRKRRAGLTVKGPGAGHGQGRERFQAAIMSAKVDRVPGDEDVYEATVLNGARYLRRKDATVFDWSASV